MWSMIKHHAKKFINKDVKELKTSNCRVKSKCPLNGQSHVNDIIYKCTVLSLEKPNKVYLRAAEDDLRKRVYKNRKSFNNETCGNDTTLSKYIWGLTETSNLNPTIVWSIAKKVPLYSNISRGYLLHLQEKLKLINSYRPDELLNKSMN